MPQNLTGCWTAEGKPRLTICQTDLDGCVTLGGVPRVMIPVTDGMYKADGTPTPYDGWVDAQGKPSWSSLPDCYDPCTVGCEGCIDNYGCPCVYLSVALPVENNPPYDFYPEMTDWWNNHTGFHLHRSSDPPQGGSPLHPLCYYKQEHAVSIISNTYLFHTLIVELMFMPYPQVRFVGRTVGSLMFFATFRQTPQVSPVQCRTSAIEDLNGIPSAPYNYSPTKNGRCTALMVPCP